MVMVDTFEVVLNQKGMKVGTIRRLILIDYGNIL